MWMERHASNSCPVTSRPRALATEDAELDAALKLARELAARKAQPDVEMELRNRA